MKRPTGKTVAAVAGLCVLTLALLFWRDIAIQYHLYRLQSNPDYLLTSAQSSEESASFLAVQKYLGTPKGKLKFFDLYLDRCISVVNQHAADLADGSILAVGEIPGSCYWAIRGKTGLDGRFGGHAQQIEGHEFLHSASRFLEFLSSERFTSTGLPRLQFTFVTADTIFKQFGFCPDFHGDGKVDWIFLNTSSSVSEYLAIGFPDNTTENDIVIMKNALALLIKANDSS